ncbi:MAG: GLPGLI family protein [Chryseobacterium cucumeris]|nr:MAG: GLPGLI family protein [Chryseobacterium cucumeris]
MYYYKKLITLLILLYSILSYALSYEKDTLQGDFTYRLKGRLNRQTDYIHEELFSLQVSNNRAFFTSVQSLKRDSVIENSLQTTKNPDGSISLSLAGVSVPKTRFLSTILQTNENIQYFQLAGMSLLTYKQPVMNGWKLINESKIINTLHCKKAELSYRGRIWVAWYSTEIPFPYGPYKFGGLPGLIIKIADETGDFDFELVKSVPTAELKGKPIKINKRRYTEAIETTQPKLEQALKTARENAAAVLASYGTTILKGQEIVRQKQREQQQNLAYDNPIELEK